MGPSLSVNSPGAVYSPGLLAGCYEVLDWKRQLMAATCPGGMGRRRESVARGRR
ncbi:hypothetical protein IMZ48_00580 [Candidatus Bathyarchaeota archaeon]|nr:hypothetical protein [Candidatus Bathyarchaeota archaeon]